MIARTMQFFAQTMMSERSPQAIGLAVGLGTCLGLIPKSNLIAVAMLAALFLCRTNLLVGLLTASIISWFSPLLDPVTHVTGHWLLTQPQMQPFFQRVFSLPGVAWTSLNNSVVLGSLLLAMSTFLPIRLAVAWLLSDRPKEKRPSAVREKPSAEPPRFVVQHEAAVG